MLEKIALPKNSLDSGYLQARDVFVAEFLIRLQNQGLEIIDPNRVKGEIFRFDKKGNPTAMRVRATTAKAYKTWSGGHNMPLGGSGAELWLPIPKAGEADSANLRLWMTSEYSGGKPKESGQQGRLEPSADQSIYGSGWDPEESSVPEMGSGGNRGPQSGGETKVTPAMPEDIGAQEDSAVDDKSEWPAHLDVVVKESNLKLRSLYNWFLENGHEYEARKVIRLASIRER